MKVMNNEKTKLARDLGVLQRGPGSEALSYKMKMFRTVNTAHKALIH